MRYLFSLLLLMGSLSVKAQVRVAFFEAHYLDGSIVELTEGGQFYHVAIHIGGKWYHTSTKKGVTTMDGLHSLADIRLVEILENKDITLRYKDIKPYLGLKFDYTYSWDRPGTTYCSKFIAQLLEIPPKKMDFSTKHWERANTVDKQSLGVSPDYLFEKLIEQGFVPRPIKSSRYYNSTTVQCHQVFAS